MTTDFDLDLEPCARLHPHAECRYANRDMPAPWKCYRPSIGELTEDRLAEGLHAEQANRIVGCGIDSESHDDHMEWHRDQAGRILRFLAVNPSKNASSEHGSAA